MAEPTKPKEYEGSVGYCLTRTRKTGIEETLLMLYATNDILFNDATFTLPGRHRLNHEEFVKVRYIGNRDATPPARILSYTIYEDNTFQENKKAYAWSGEELPY